LKVAKWLDVVLKNKEIDSYVISLHELSLPLVHEDIWSDLQNDENGIKLRQVLGQADGFVVISPEWSGMANPALKNMFLYVNEEMAHKPALLVGVSNSRGGAYPVAELRMSSYKNTHINYIPEHLIVRDVAGVMNDPKIDSGDKSDQYIKARAVYALDVLVEYTKAGIEVRNSGVIDHKTYPHGM
jgi:NAD(P)H-dependent FMN reductase